MDRADFDEHVAPLRRELHAHCYRMLGSLQDADDALQEALIGAWRGLGGFEGRSTLRSWLYKVATHACLALIAQRPRRILSPEYGPADPGGGMGAMMEGPMWLEPYPDDPAAKFAQREAVELAFVAALQHLPATQRAVLVLREVLGFSAEEVGELLETSVPSVNSALQRARATVAERVPELSQQATLRELGDDGTRALVTSLVSAWERADVPAILALLTRDARFTMPPIPTWFEGHDGIGRFLRERLFETEWKLVPTRASGQLALACYQGPSFRLGALCVLTLRGAQVAALTGFLDPALFLPDRPMSFGVAPTHTGS